MLLRQHPLRWLAFQGVFHTQRLRAVGRIRVARHAVYAAPNASQVIVITAKLDLRFVEQQDLRCNAVEALDCAVAVDPPNCFLFEADNDAHRDGFLCRRAPAYYRPRAFALTR